MVTITELDEKEISQAIKLLRDTWRDTYSSILPAETIEKASSLWHNPNLLNKQIKNPEVRFLAARENNTITAIATVVKRSDGNIVIARLYVHPSHQHKGVGKRLLEDSIAAFPEAKMVHVEVEEHNTKAIQFYEKHGFTKIGTRSENIEGTMLKITIMEKPL